MAIGVEVIGSEEAIEIVGVNDWNGEDLVSWRVIVGDSGARRRCDVA